MNSFKFYPVGQGLFYTGSLAHNTYNFVYDCGTESKKQYLNSSIDLFTHSTRNKDAKRVDINFVVISHLHRDHFSGLFNLVQKANVQKVYLPYLGHDRNLISLILAHIIFDDMIEDDQYDNYSLFSFMIRLYGIEDNSDFPRIKVIFIEESGDKKSEKGALSYSIYNDHVDIGSQKYWKFVFISRAIDDFVIEQLNLKVSAVLDHNGINSIVDLLSMRNGIKHIAKIYHEVFVNEIRKDSNFLNKTSIVLIHYPLYNSPDAFFADGNEIVMRTSRTVESRYFNHCYPCMNNHFDFRRLLTPITILSGDVMIDQYMEMIIIPQLRMYKDEALSLCGILQVPHHGSKDNWIAWKHTSITSEVCVISFGLGNRHRHPHPETIYDLICSKQSAQFVNQTQGFEYYID